MQARFLEIWERCVGRGNVELGLILLAEACPEATLKVLAELPVGQRDALIFRLREKAFGSKIVGISTCPGCQEKIELSFNVADIIQKEPRSNCSQTMMLDHQGYEVNFRLPNSYDLLIASAKGNPESAYSCLIERCVLSACSEKERISALELPSEVIEIMADMMSQADSTADLQMKIECSSCGHQWLQTFDIIWFFGKEIDSWAHRAIRDVNDLAGAYGWSEAEILSLSPWRRQHYLEAINRDRGN
jgi:hypothetical protein